MGFAPVPAQAGIQTALRAFLLSVLPAGVEVVEGADNRVPEPAGVDFVVMTTILRERLSTNVDTYADCAFTGSIAAAVLTVTAIQLGAITIGNALFGTGVTAGTTITAQTSGPAGGAGTYAISPSQNVSAGTLACGAENILQPVKITVQLDVHSANVADSNDMAQTISTMLRDDYAMTQFKASGFDVWPLYASDPRQVPFLNAEQQWETRWIVDAVLQANQVVTPGQQFATQVQAGLINVEKMYPAT